jgi:hypothetical protein
LRGFRGYDGVAFEQSELDIWKTRSSNQYGIVGLAWGRGVLKDKRDAPLLG